MNSKRSVSKFTAWVLIIALILSTMPITLAVAEEQELPSNIGVVTAFTPLEEEVAQQTVPPGTPLEEIILPATLTAEVIFTTPGGLGVVLKPTEDQQENFIHIPTELPVTWEAEPDFDGNTAETYIFTPTLAEEGFVLFAPPPVIMVTVEAPLEGEAETETETVTITAFLPIAYETARQTVPFGTELDELDLPQTLTAVVAVDDENETKSSLETVIEASEVKEIEVPVTWEAKPEYDGFAGEFVFTAAVDEGFVLAEGVEPPRLVVEVEPLGVMALDESIPFIDENGILQITEWAVTTHVSGANINNFSEGWHFISGNVIGNGRITIQGSVHLILENGAHLDASNGGINVPASSSLTVYAQSTGYDMGKLTATGIVNNNAGIGGNGGAGVIVCFKEELLELAETEKIAEMSP